MAKLLTETMGTNPDLSKYYGCASDAIGNPNEAYICYVTGSGPKTGPNSPQQGMSGGLPMLRTP